MKRLFYLLAAAAFTACGSATTLSVMTFNMRYDNPEDGADNWRFRRGRVAEVIASHGVDVFGTQELLANQLGDLKRLLPGYAAVGVGREDGAEAGSFYAPRIRDFLAERNPRRRRLERVGRRLRARGNLGRIA